MKIIITTLLFFLALPSHADDGGETGGGNSVNGQMIEQYLVVDPYKSLPEFKSSVDALIVYLEKRLPMFAELTRKTVVNWNWYVIPRKIRLLPEHVTGLRFESNQCAYQNKAEIFIDGDCLRSLTLPDAKGTLYRHELWMATFRAVKDSCSNRNGYWRGFDCLRDVEAMDVRRIDAFIRKNSSASAGQLRGLIYEIFDIRETEPIFYTKIAIETTKQYYGVVMAKLNTLCDSDIEAKEKAKLIDSLLRAPLCIRFANNSTDHPLSEEACYAEHVLLRNWFGTMLGKYYAEEIGLAEHIVSGYRYSDLTFFDFRFDFHNDAALFCKKFQNR